MEHNYNFTNKIADDMRRLTGKAVFAWLGFSIGISVFIGILRAADALSKQTAWTLLGAALSAASLILLVTLYQWQKQSLAKEQRISAMAFQARMAIDDLQREFPDTFRSDCQIRMRYLAKNGVDVDRALSYLNGNVDLYNRLVIAFLNESDEIEDDLFDAMQPETLYRYGYMARQLRLKTSRLGLTKLSDTAFFHEVESYSGDFAIVHDNWEKLSFELDEAYGILFEYIKSLGLENNAPGKTDSQMTCRRWGERLQEACYALETYDTIKAKRILSELNKYQIESEITKTLQGIIANIDEIMAN